MRNDTTSDYNCNDNNNEIRRLQQQIDSLQLRTQHVESLLVANRPTRPVQSPVQRAPRTGDFVTFGPTKITPGGIGRITKVVNNFVIIRRCNNGKTVQRAPRNVKIISTPGNHPHDGI